MQAIQTVVDLPMDETEAKVRTSLAAHGFGVLTEIDVATTLKAKLGVDRPPLKILGACNPTFAHRVLEPRPLVEPVAAVQRGARAVPLPGAPGSARSTHCALLPGDELAELAGEAAEGLRGALDDAGA